MKIYAPFAGIIRYVAKDGDRVDTGDELAIIEAVKLEAPVLAPGPGIVCQRNGVSDFSDVTGGEEIMTLEAIE